MTRHRGRSVYLPLFAVLAFACFGCTDQYSIDRPGTWQPTGANDYNLRAMVANPRDLQEGEAATTDRGNVGANAVRRLDLELRRPLPSESSMTSTTAQGGEGSPLPGLGANIGGH